MDKDNEVKESSGTDSPKASELEYRSFVEEPGEDDGENRKPTKRKEFNYCYFSLSNEINDRFRPFICSLSFQNFRYYF